MHCDIRFILCPTPPLSHFITAPPSPTSAQPLPPGRTHLLGEELCLDEVAHLGVSVGTCHRVQVEQCLVDGLLQLEGGADGQQRRAPLVLGGLHHRLQHHPAAALVLELHQLLCVLPLLVRGLLEVVEEAREGDVVPVEEVGLRKGGICWDMRNSLAWTCL